MWSSRLRAFVNKKKELPCRFDGPHELLPVDDIEYSTMDLMSYYPRGVQLHGCIMSSARNRDWSDLVTKISK